MNQISYSNDQVKHSAAHVLAMAVKRLYGNVKIGIGPVTKEGFYYDFDLPKQITTEDFPKIETEIEKIITENIQFSQLTLSKPEAVNMLLQRGEIYKAELVQSIPDEDVSLYKTGDSFIDLCRGPHVKSTNQIGIVKLLRVENVHWKEDRNRPVMQRIYGAVFRTTEELNEYLKLKTELQTRNYKKIATRIKAGFEYKDKFILNRRGNFILNKIEDNILKTLEITNPEEVVLYNIENTNSAFMQIRKLMGAETPSYKYFPKIITSDFYTNTQVKDENLNIKNIVISTFLKTQDTLTFLGSYLEKALKVFENLNIDISADVFCTNLEETNLKTISNILKANHVSHTKVLTKNFNYILIKLKTVDSFRREWEFGSIRIDDTPTDPVRYTTDENASELAVIVETVFNPFLIFSYILEEKNGELPSFLRPIQIACIPINKNQNNYAKQVADLLDKKGFRTLIDLSSKSMQAKIKIAENEEIPIILVIGNKEVVNNAVSLRHNSKEVGLISLENLDEYLIEAFK